MLMKIFGEEEAGGWRRLHNEELHNFYFSLNIIRESKSRKRSGRAMQHGYEI
jgi:hypothetical protein